MTLTRIQTEMFSRLTRIGYVAFILCISVGSACVAVELVLRLTSSTQYDAQQNDPKTGLILYKPGITFRDSSSCFDNTMQMNSHGLNGPEYSTTKSPNTFRIVVMGSSFVEAVQLAQTQNFSHQLEALLNQDPHKKTSYEVIPFGVSGNGTYLDYLYYDAYIAQLKPDLVIDFATEYELTRDAPTVDLPPRFNPDGTVVLQVPRIRQNPTVLSIKNAAKSSKLLMNLEYRALVVDASLHSFAQSPHLFGTQTGNTTASASEQTSTTDALWNIETPLLTQLSNTIQKNGSHFLLTTWFTKQVDEATKATDAAHYLKISQDAHFPYTDLTPTLTANELKSGQSPVWSCDDHWNVTGHTWAAQTLYEYLKTHSELVGGTTK